VSADHPAASRAGSTPSALDIVLLSRHLHFPPGGRDLYRQIAVLTAMGGGDEVLVAPCGRGVTLDFFAREFGIHGSGVDEDQSLVDAAEAGVDALVRSRVQFQQAGMDDLPYRDGVFDLVVGEIGLTSRVSPEVAIGELTRVLKPAGRIALVQLVWRAPVDAERQALLSSHLGARPVMLVDLTRMLEVAGVERLHTEAWSGDGTAFRRAAKKPFPDFAELFGVAEKLAILRRVWRRWGWRAVFTAVARQAEIHRLLTKERVLGLDLVMGTRCVEPMEPDREETPDLGPHSTEVQGLPLFGPGKDR
jgi:SAM-dependent methyltransferase